MNDLTDFSQLGHREPQNLECSPDRQEGALWAAKSMPEHPVAAGGPQPEEGKEAGTPFARVGSDERIF